MTTDQLCAVVLIERLHELNRIEDANPGDPAHAWGLEQDEICDRLDDYYGWGGFKPGILTPEEWAEVEAICNA